MRLSARNQLSGTIESIKEGVVTAEVVVKLAKCNWYGRRGLAARTGPRACPLSALPR